VLPQQTALPVRVSPQVCVLPAASCVKVVPGAFVLLSCAPQQTAFPAGDSAQERRAPTATCRKRPAGGWSAPASDSPQQTSLPSVATAQAWRYFS
jgi:hypothetical protein